MIDGHLNLARSVAAGEYWVALNNYVPLTINVKLAGGPTDFWALDPVALAFGSIGINTQAPHPKTALLAANYMLSHEGQTFLTQERPAADAAGRGHQSAGRDGHPADRRRSSSQFRRPPSSAKMQQTFNAIFRPR